MTKTLTHILIIFLFSFSSLAVMADVTAPEGTTPQTDSIENKKSGQSSFDDDEETLDDGTKFDDEEEELEEDGIGLDDEEELDLDNIGDVDENEKVENRFSSLWNGFKKDSRFTYRHELASHTDETDRLILNRSSLRLEWEHLFASRFFILFDGKVSYDFIYDSQDYPDETENEYKFQHQVREFYLQSGNDRTSFKIGKQIVVWGEADAGTVTDIISPRDMTEFIYTPIEDSRIGQVMISVDQYSNFGQWSLVINPDPEVNVYAKPGHVYALPSLSNQPGIVVKNEDKPSFGFGDAEIGLRWKKTLGQSDFSLMTARVVDNNPIFQFVGVNSQGEMVLVPIYEKYTMVGAAANRSSGNFLWKVEAAYKFGKSWNYVGFVPGDGILKKDVMDTVVGIEYNANSAWMATLEIGNQHIVDYTDEIFGVRRDETTLYFLWSKDFLHQTLKTQYSYAYQAQSHDSIHMLEATYDINDSWSSEFGLTCFDINDENGQLGIFKDRHRISLEIIYHF